MTAPQIYTTVIFPPQVYTCNPMQTFEIALILGQYLCIHLVKLCYIHGHVLKMLPQSNFEHNLNIIQLEEYELIHFFVFRECILLNMFILNELFYLTT